jgi:hypothetical protein
MVCPKVVDEKKDVTISVASTLEKEFMAKEYKTSLSFGNSEAR